MTDDGVVYSFSVLPHAGSRFRKLPQGAEELETVFDDFPSDFSFWEPSVFLGPAEAVMLGRFGGALQDHVAGIVVVDLATGEATSHRLPELTLLTLIESDAGDQTASENAEPALVWDESRNRILIVHGVETKVSILDLGTGEVSTHDWSTPTTQLADLFAWLIPPAHAKGGPSRGTRRTAVLSPSGDRLFVASSISRIVEFPPGDGWYVEGISQGLEVINTETWDLAHRWEIPASEVTLSGRQIPGDNRSDADRVIHRPRGTGRECLRYRHRPRRGRGQVRAARIMA